MQWLELTIRTTSAGIEALGARLTAWGYDSFVVDDQAEYENFLDENRKYWDYIDDSLAQRLQGLSQIRLYIESDSQSESRIAGLRQRLAELPGQAPTINFGTLELTAVLLPEQDWESSWKDNYPPIPVGRRLVVMPCWLREQPPEERTPIFLDPGLTFGTGAHPSTQMCMEALERTLRGGERVADLGSGSGILSITALILGAGSAIGVDIDAKAENMARENAGLNSIGPDRFQAFTADVANDKAAMCRLAAGGYDVVLVNIVADVIISLAPVLPTFLRPSGTLITSGILDNRLDDVSSALISAGFEILEIHTSEEWRCIIAHRASEGNERS